MSVWFSNAGVTTQTSIRIALRWSAGVNSSNTFISSVNGYDVGSNALYSTPYNYDGSTLWTNNYITVNGLSPNTQYRFYIKYYYNGYPYNATAEGTNIDPYKAYIQATTLPTPTLSVTKIGFTADITTLQLASNVSLPTTVTISPTVNFNYNQTTGIIDISGLTLNTPTALTISATDYPDATITVTQIIPSLSYVASSITKTSATVTLTSDNNVLPDTISISPSVNNTYSNGVISFSGLSVGTTYNLTLSASGYQDCLITFSTNPLPTISCTLNNAIDTLLSISVTSTENSVPSTVTISPTFSNWNYDNGTLVISQLTANTTYNITVSADGYLPFVGSFSTRSPNTIVCTLNGAADILLSLNVGSTFGIVPPSISVSPTIGTVIYDNGTLVITDLSPGTAYTITLSSPNYLPYVGTFTTSGSTTTPSVPCFVKNTPVLTPSGYRPIHKLKAGDKVTTSDGRVVSVIESCHYRVKADIHNLPYIIPAGKFGAKEDVRISPAHKVCVGGEMVEAQYLNLKKTTWNNDFIDYYNLELPNWKTDNMVVAGVHVESKAPIRRIVVSNKQFIQLLVQQYGEITPNVLDSIKKTCKFLKNDRVEIPVLKK